MDDFESVIEELQLLEEDGVPKNVKVQIEEIISFLKDENIDRSIRISKALVVLDNIANDINLAPHCRTQFWNLSSMLESY